MATSSKVVIDKPTYRVVQYTDADGSIYYVEFPKEPPKKKKRKGTSNDDDP